MSDDVKVSDHLDEEEMYKVSSPRQFSPLIEFESQIAHKHNEPNYDQEEIKKWEFPPIYGELLILGYNGGYPPRDEKRETNKYILRKRAVPNGIKKSKQYAVKTPKASRAFSDSRRHSVSYQFSRTTSTIVEYVSDENTDMFQIGRSLENPIDFVVADAVSVKSSTSAPGSRTISRYACRIIVNRNENPNPRIYAAGFDTFCNIFLGELAIKWQYGSEVDGLTTNGVHIMHPQNSFSNNPAPGIWREVSVEGDLYSVESDLCSRPGEKIENENNILQDGTLIDLCGVTLLWRSVKGLSKTPTRNYLEGKVKERNESLPFCPVLLNPLTVPMISKRYDESLERTNSAVKSEDSLPYIYLVCGHVQSWHGWCQNEKTKTGQCPLCRQKGPIAKLRTGIESSFYVDIQPPTFAFNPCGHTASEKTVKYWKSVCMFSDVTSICPFCSTTLSDDPGYVKLIFQDKIPD